MCKGFQDKILRPLRFQRLTKFNWEPDLKAAVNGQWKSGIIAARFLQWRVNMKKVNFHLVVFS